MAAVAGCAAFDYSEPVPEFSLPPVIYQGQTYVFKDLVPRINYTWSVSNSDEAWFDGDMLVINDAPVKSVVESDQHQSRPLTVIACNRKHPEYTYEQKAEIHPWAATFVSGNGYVFGEKCAVGSQISLAIQDVVTKKIVESISDGHVSDRYNDLELVVEPGDWEDGLELVSAGQFSTSFKAVVPGTYTITATLHNGSRKDLDVSSTATVQVE